MKFLIIGLTGQTGAGKSTLAQRLAEEGFPIIDADVAAREITATGSLVLNELAVAFGQDIICADGSLDRRLLASRAFASKVSTKKLNRITHPAITASIKNKIKHAQNSGARAVVIDAAVLLESGLAEECDIIAVVTAPFDIRLERIMRRDGLSKDEALKRIKIQPTDEAYFDKADIILQAHPPSIVEEETEKLMRLIDEKINQ